MTTTTYLLPLSRIDANRLSESLPSNGTPGQPLPDANWTWYTPDTLMASGAIRNMTVYVGEPSPDAASTRPGIVTSRSGLLLDPYPLPDWWTDAMTCIDHEIPAIPWMQRVGPVDPAWRVFPTWKAAIDAAWDTGWRPTPPFQTRMYRTIEGIITRAGRYAAANSLRNSGQPATRDAAYQAIAADATRSGTDDETTFHAAHDRLRLVMDDLADHASLYLVVTYAGRGLDIDPRTAADATATWQVWQRGYGTIGSVRGTIYAYEHVI